MLIIVGKSGSGKTSVVEALKNFGYQKIVTDTTRKIRIGEIRDVDYHFLSQEEFDKRKQAGLYAEGVTYHATFGTVSYGSRKEDYADKSDHKVIILNPYGLKSVIANGLADNATSVYLKLDDESILKRLALRGDVPEEVKRRLETDRKDFEGMESICDIVISITDGMTLEDVVAKLLEEIKK